MPAFCRPCASSGPQGSRGRSGCAGVTPSTSPSPAAPRHEAGRVVSGIGGRQEAVMYVARVYVPGVDRLLFQRFAGVRLSEGDQPHRIILGRTSLRRYRMSDDARTGAVEIVED